MRLSRLYAPVIVGFMLFGSAGMASALSVNVNGIDVNVNQNPTGGVNVNTNVNGVPTNVNVNTTTSGTGAAANVNVNGTVIQLERSGGSLNVLVSGGSLSGNDASTVVNLSGGSDVLIKTSTDLNAYNQLVVQQRPSIVSVSTDNGAVNVQYHQPSKFLGLFSTDLTGTVVVDATGQVSVQLPWYSFLFTKNTDAVKADVTAGIQQAGNGLKVSVVGSSDTSSTTVRQKAHVVNVVTAAIHPTASTQSSTSSTSNTVSSNHPGCNAPSQFPFSNYPGIVEVAAGSQNSTVIGSNLDVKSQSQSTLVIGQVVDMGPANDGSHATTVYAFNGLDLGANSTIGTAYVSTNASTQLRGHVDQVIRLSPTDLTRKAMVAAGLLGAACNY